MPRINILPKHIADLIAAGEVVERPASVIKELMENAIDAGATSITVEIKRGGITYMRVTDNGCGIAEEDVRTAFKSHATSKIEKEDDLSGIGTLGFRGEALASVAAVSKVSLLTRTPGSEIGNIIEIEGSEETLFDSAGCPEGTTIVVKNLFYNTPARMKFMRKDVTEGNAVAGVVDRIALSHPEISVRFIRDDKQQLVTPGTGDLNSCAYSVFGKSFTEGMVETEYTLNHISVKGLVSLPSAARANRSMQFFYLNGRLVKSRTMQAALEQAYKGSLMVKRFPSCILMINMPLDLVDVNVHPAKMEVRFENEKPVFNAVYYAVKSAIDRKDVPNRLELTERDLKSVNPFKGREEKAEQIGMKDFGKGERFLRGSLKKTGSKTKERRNEEKLPEPEKVQEAMDKLYGATIEVEKNEPVPVPTEKKTGIFGRKREATPLKTEKSPEPVPYKRTMEKRVETEEEEERPVPFSEREKTPEYRVVGEIFKTYIVVESEGKVLLIDKHAAHERMLYEKLKKENSSCPSQVLMLPITVSLSKEEYSKVLENRDLISETGFLIDDFGSGTVVIRECPVMLTDEDPEAVIQEIAGHLIDDEEPVPEKLDWIYHNIACRAAVKAGDNLTEEEQEQFVSDLLGNPDIRYCPHGRPVFIEITEKELKKQFGRIQG